MGKDGENKPHVKEDRMGLLAQIVEEMEAAGELPLPTANKLAQTIMRYWAQGDYDHEQLEFGYTWGPNVRYVKRNIAGIRSALVSKKKYLVYYRWLEMPEKGKKGVVKFRGEWKFVGKTHYKTMMIQENTDIATRVDTHNQHIDDGEKRWKLDISHIAEVPLLTN